MKKIGFSLFGIFVLVASLAHAGTVRLVNDSPYKLRAVIRANDGTFLGEQVINSQSSNTWTDGFAGLPGGLQAARLQTPYTVLWYCLEGDPFATLYPVASGGTAQASLGDGAKQCRPQRQRVPDSEVQPAPPIPVPQQPQGGYPQMQE